MAFIPPSSSYQISLRHLKGEYGTGPSGSISFGDLYRNGSLVKNNGSTSTIPTSGAISASNFYNTQNKFFYLLKDQSDFPQIHIYLHHYDNFTDTTKDYNADGTYSYTYGWTGGYSTLRGTYPVSNVKYNIVTYFTELSGTSSGARYIAVKPTTLKRFGQSFGAYNSSSYNDYYPTNYSTSTPSSSTYNEHYTINPSYYTGTEYRYGAHPVVDSDTDSIRVATAYYGGTSTYNYDLTLITYDANVHSTSDVTRHCDAASDISASIPSGYVASAAISHDANYYITNWYNATQTPRYNLKGGRRTSPKTYYHPNDNNHDFNYCVSSVNDPGAGPATAATGCFLVSCERYFEAFCATTSSLYKASTQPVCNEYMVGRVMAWDPTDTYCAIGTSTQGYQPGGSTVASDGYTFFLKRTSTTWTTIWPNVKNTFNSTVTSIAWDSTSTYVAFTYSTYNSSLGGTCVIYKRSGDTFTKLTAFETFDAIGCGFHPPGTYGSTYP